MEPNEHDRTDGFDVTDINRRKLLQGVGAAGAIGVLGTGSAAAKGQPCFKDFECSDDATKVKFEFIEEDDDCYFEEETDTGLITIDDFDSKDGEDCEPISVDWSVEDGYEAAKVKAYGGQDCDEVEELDSTGGTFEPELETPNDNTAAISNLQFCVVEEEPDVPPEGQEHWQVDLIAGDPIEEFCDDNCENCTSYNGENRLLQALWSSTGLQTFIDQNRDTLPCGHDLDIVESISYDSETSTATATLNPGTCSCDEFDLVSYSSELGNFDDDGCGQELLGSAQGDAPYEGTVETNGDGNCVYTVGVPDGGADS